MISQSVCAMIKNDKNRGDGTKMKQANLSLFELVQTMRKHKLLCALLVLGCMALCACYTLFLSTPLYETELKFSLTAAREEQKQDYTYTQKAAVNYANIFQGNIFLDRVIEQSGITETSEHLGKMLRISTLGSGLVDIRVKSETPEKSLLLAQTIAELAEQEISGDLNMRIYHAPQEGKRVTPGLFLSLATGLVSGLVFSLCAAGFLLMKEKNSALQNCLDMVK